MSWILTFCLFINLVFDSPTYQLDNHGIQIKLDKDWHYQKKNDSTYLFKKHCEDASSCIEMRFQISKANQNKSFEQFLSDISESISKDYEKYDLHSFGKEIVNDQVFNTVYLTVWVEGTPFSKVCLLRQRGNDNINISMIEPKTGAWYYTKERDKIRERLKNLEIKQ